MQRPYRFPPLDLVQAQSRSAPASAQAHPDAQRPAAQALAQAFEQAAQRGHAQGFEQGLQAGEQAGYADGLQAGRQDARAEQQQVAQAELIRLGAPLTQALQQLQALHADWQASLRKDMIDLVERVARQVVRCELTLQPAQILALVEETLSGMPQRSGPVQVYLNAADLQRIQELDASRIPAWQLHADSALEAGECRLQVGDVEVDAGCRQRLQACMEQVREQILPEETAGDAASAAREAGDESPPTLSIPVKPRAAKEPKEPRVVKVPKEPKVAKTPRAPKAAALKEVSA